MNEFDHHPRTSAPMIFRRTRPIADQGAEGSSVGHAFAQDIYGRAQQLDEWPGEYDAGTSLLATAKELALADHRCNVQNQDGDKGDFDQCEVCGLWWKCYTTYTGRPAWSRRPAWWSRLVLRVRKERRRLRRRRTLRRIDMIPEPSGVWARVDDLVVELHELLSEMEVPAPHTPAERLTLGDIHQRSLESIRVTVNHHWTHTYAKIAYAPEPGDITHV